MIRISVFLWLGFLGLLGVGLFQVKYNVQAKEKELREIHRKTAESLESIRVLEAEWSYLNDPLRLADLARRHTDLIPMTPSQIGTFDKLPARAPQTPTQPPQTGENLLASTPQTAPEQATQSHGDPLIDTILADMKRGEANAAQTVLPAGILPAGTLPAGTLLVQPAGIAMPKETGGTQ